MTLDVSSNVGIQCLPLLLLLLLQRWRAILRHYRVIVIVTCRTAPYSVPQPFPVDWPGLTGPSIGQFVGFVSTVHPRCTGGRTAHEIFVQIGEVVPRVACARASRPEVRHTGGLEATRPGGHVSSPRFSFRAVSPACPPCLWTMPRHVLIRSRIRHMEINHYTD